MIVIEHLSRHIPYRFIAASALGPRILDILISKDQSDDYNR